MFDLAELQALPLPRCSALDLKGLPDHYLSTFLPPRLTQDGRGLSCIGCGSVLYQPGPIGFLMGATFTWGLANGEGHCDRCGYPTRMYHRVPDGKATFPVQYHPDELIRDEAEDE